MQLWGELKTPDKNILKKCYQLGSLLLVTVFLSISFIQALHSHKSSPLTEQSSNNSDETISDASPCQICDYVIHKQGKQIFHAYSAVLVLPVPEPLVYYPHSFVGNYKFTLQGFTNKGPPAFSC